MGSIVDTYFLMVQGGWVLPICHALAARTLSCLKYAHRKLYVLMYVQWRCGVSTIYMLFCNNLSSMKSWKLHVVWFGQFMNWLLHWQLCMQLRKIEFLIQLLCPLSCSGCKVPLFITRCQSSHIPSHPRIQSKHRGTGKCWEMWGLGEFGFSPNTLPSPNL